MHQQKCTENIMCHAHSLCLQNTTALLQRFCPSNGQEHEEPHRGVCKATEAGFVTFEGLPGQVKTGCQKTPDLQSRYCHLHKPRVCTLTDMPETEVETEACAQVIEHKKEVVEKMILEKKVA